MFKYLIRLFSCARELPYFFAFLHLVNTVTFIPIVIFLFWPWPNATYSLGEKELDYGEFWFSGMAPVMLLFALAMSYLCIATSLKNNWSRHGIFVYWSVIIGLLSFYSLVGVIVGASVILVWALYVYKNTKIRAFYSVNNA